MTTNLLKPSRKTELMVVVLKALLQKVGDFVFHMDGCSIFPSMEVCNLGVILDCTLSSESHIKYVTKSAFCCLKNIFRPSSRHSLPSACTTALGSCLGSPAKPWTSSSMCKIQLPGFSPTLILGSPSFSPSNREIHRDRAFSVAALTLWNALPMQI